MGRTQRLRLFLALLSLGVACSPGGDDGEGAESSGNGDFECSLPVPMTTNVPRPDGVPGELTVVAWAGFQGAVSYTFDDANQSQIDHYDALQALGVPMTFYLQTGKPEAGNEIWARAVEDGHELGNHTRTHPQMGTVEEVESASAFIEDTFGVHPWTMAAPYGDSSYVELARTRFLINRGVSNRLITPNGLANPFNLPTYIPPEAATAEEMFAQVQDAHDDGGWRVVLVHGFTGGSDGAYQPVDIEAFVSSVEQAKQLGGLWMDTVVDIGAYWRAHELVASVSPTEEDGERTWAWTLPESFPPGRCLRVRVDGGTLVQGGRPLEWDAHGYYEISLDAGSVTLRP